MSEDYNIQWSVSLPPAAQFAKGDMLNIRGTTAEEVEALFDQILAGDFIDKATAVGTLVRAAATVTETLSEAAPAATPVPTPPPSTPAQQAAPVAELHVCPHGKREFKSGNGSRGPWAAWMCPLPQSKKSERCEPDWVKVD